MEASKNGTLNKEQLDEIRKSGVHVDIRDGVSLIPCHGTTCTFIP